MQGLHLNAVFHHVVAADEVLLEVVLDGGAVVAVGALEGLLSGVCAQVAGQVRAQEESLRAVGTLVAGPERVAGQGSRPHRRLAAAALKHGHTKFRGKIISTVTYLRDLYSRAGDGMDREGR